jgi:hypothetical protein
VGTAATAESSVNGDGSARIRSGIRRSHKIVVMKYNKTHIFLSKLVVTSTLHLAITFTLLAVQICLSVSTAMTGFASVQLSYSHTSSSAPSLD